MRHLNPRWRSRRNVAHHYDLTDELFETFLDPRRQYSCAYFQCPDDSLETAQETKLDFALRDYRDRGGAFDRIVSVGMLEHVGPADVPAYFRMVRRLLAPGGMAVIHSIAVHDRAAPVNRWMTRYIFPGGHLPSLPQLVRAAEAGGLKILDIEIMRGH